MILIDTSAWIAFFRGTGPSADEVDNFLATNQAAICGPIFTELQRGFRSENEKRKVSSLFAGCHWLTQPHGLWEDAGNLGFHVRRKGKTIKTMDLLITCYALAHNTSLLTLDEDFHYIKKAGAPLNLI